MDLTDTKLKVLDKVIKLDLSVDDLRRILMSFRFVKYRKEIDGNSHFDIYDEVLMSWLEHQYRDSLRMEGISCL
jgi:hypothetical protein